MPDDQPTVHVDVVHLTAPPEAMRLHIGIPRDDAPGWSLTPTDLFLSQVDGHIMMAFTSWSKADECFRILAGHCRRAGGAVFALPDMDSFPPAPEGID